MKNYEARGKVWSKLEGQNEINWHDYLVLEILTPDSMWRLRPENAKMIKRYQRDYIRKHGKS